MIRVDLDFITFNHERMFFILQLFSHSATVVGKCITSQAGEVYLRITQTVTCKWITKGGSKVDYKGFPSEAAIVRVPAFDADAFGQEPLIAVV